jgi:hypothetical protein
LAGASDGERAAVAHGTATRVYHLAEDPEQTATNQERD